MRKLSGSLLVVMALLAIFGSAFAAFAASSDPSAYLTAHPDFIIVGRANPNFSGFTPQQFKKAYDIDNLSQQGKGITIAIIDACGNTAAQSDLNAYDTKYNLPNTTITVVTPQGTPCSDPGGWGVETDLDLQMAHSIAPQANLVLEEGAKPTFKDLNQAAQDAYTKQGATIVSMSYGGAEWQGETKATNDGIFKAGNKMGVSFTASSGDSGCGAQYPAASPYVTSVGGTSLYTKSDGTYIKESAWSGSGGGLSKYEARPTYQNTFNPNPNRSIPDVAMVADPATGVLMYDSQIGGWIIVGGTSVAAPMWAGVLADTNSGRSHTLHNADYALYAVALNHYATDFHDITKGSSGSNCNARKGFDYVTGFGTPDADQLVPDLINYAP